MQTKYFTRLLSSLTVCTLIFKKAVHHVENTLSQLVFIKSQESI